jgi:hypothetical protein
MAERVHCELQCTKTATVKMILSDLSSRHPLTWNILTHCWHSIESVYSHAHANGVVSCIWQSRPRHAHSTTADIVLTCDGTTFTWFILCLPERVCSAAVISLSKLVRLGVSSQWSVLDPILFLTTSCRFTEANQTSAIGASRLRLQHAHVCGFCQRLTLTTLWQRCRPVLKNSCRLGRQRISYNSILRKLKSSDADMYSVKRQIPKGPVRIGDANVLPVSSARDFDAEISLRTRGNSTIWSCFAALRQICNVWRSLPCTTCLADC